MMGYGWGHGGLGLGLLMLIFWIGLIFLVVWVVNSIFHNRHRMDQRMDQRLDQLPPDRRVSAREILDLRYARGEITREQYELMKNDLSSGQP
jgi:putative membrane protein